MCCKYLERVAMLCDLYVPPRYFHHYVLHQRTGLKYKICVPLREQIIASKRFVDAQGNCS